MAPQHMVLKSEVHAETLLAVVSIEGLQWRTAAGRKKAGSAADGSGVCTMVSQHIHGAAGTRAAAWAGCRCQAGSVML